MQHPIVYDGCEAKTVKCFCFKCHDQTLHHLTRVGKFVDGAAFVHLKCQGCQNLCALSYNKDEYGQLARHWE